MRCKHIMSVHDHNNGNYTIKCKLCHKSLDTRNFEEVCLTRVGLVFTSIVAFGCGLFLGVIYGMYINLI